jgi:hypothetical protein
LHGRIIQQWLAKEGKIAVTDKSSELGSWQPAFGAAPCYYSRFFFAPAQNIELQILLWNHPTLQFLSK